ncbi:MAG: SprT family zinc-dependent metalloprotease [Hyphomicrobiales bacterium]|jgi:predicted metal-dependent hydrolase
MFKPLLTTLEAGRTRISSVLPSLEMPSTVEVRGEPRTLRVRVHAKARRMILRFDVRTGEGRLTVPRGTPPSAALTFLSQSRGWIDGHAPELPSAGDARHPDILPFKGEDLRIVPTGRIRGTVSRGSECDLLVPGAPHRIMPRVAQFLKTEAEQTLTPLVMEHCDQLGRRPSAIRYRDPRSQWGSCSSARVVTLSWRVMMAAPHAQRYLVAHEVAHLVEMNHSQRFWKVVASLDPNWKSGQKALKAAEKRLMAIRFN